MCNAQCSKTAAMAVIVLVDFVWIPPLHFVLALPCPKGLEGSKALSCDNLTVANYATQVCVVMPNTGFSIRKTDVSPDDMPGYFLDYQQSCGPTSTLTVGFQISGKFKQLLAMFLCS